MTLVPVLEVICDWGRSHLKRTNNANPGRKKSATLC
jgi:hypothetical protein